MTSLNSVPSSVTSKSSKHSYRSARDIRWCSGCGDFHVLNALTSTWDKLQLPREQIALISGIGCSSRLPYYCSTYGFHTIHGRAPTVAYGLHRVRPDLSIWIITGDGDGLSIGGNHLIHLCRRNPNMTLLLFNNEIYGLTKGQSSPTSAPHLRTRSTPRGTSDQPINALQLAISSGATFAARVIDTDLVMMREVFTAAHHHQGLGFVEILTSCVVFNEHAFKDVEKRSWRQQNCLILRPNQPLIVGTDPTQAQALTMSDFTPQLTKLAQTPQAAKITHDPGRIDSHYAYMLAGLRPPHQALALGILRDVTPIQAQQPRSVPQKPPNRTPLQELFNQQSFQIGASSPQSTPRSSPSASQ